MAHEFDNDLLAREDVDGHNDSMDIEHHQHREHQTADIMVWHKVISPGLQGTPREGHSSVAYHRSLYVFGGVENGRRTNTVMKLDVVTSKWMHVPCGGAKPCPRSHHTSHLIGKYMIIHGGEGIKPTEIELDAVTKAFEISSRMMQGTGILDNHSSTITDKQDPSISGICPGDGLGGKARHSVKIVDPAENTAIAPSTTIVEQDSVISTLDDFYALNLETHFWHKIQCSLAPLPRKGHSMNVAPVLVDGEIQEVLVVFGGYASESHTLSNSLHICTCRDILSTLDKYETKILKNSGILDYAAPVTWRILHCSGKPPPARYRHCACVIPDSNIMVVFGGIVNSTDTIRASNEIFVLDFNSLAWVRTHYGSDALSHRLSGDGPPPIYGHVAFPIKSSSKEEYRWDVIVYGGSSNISRSAAGCQHQLYRFHTLNHTWSKLSTGYLFPPERCGHSVSILCGWSPLNHYPHEIELSSVDGDSSPRRVDELNEDCVTAIVFGGNNSLMCPADPWVLDLTWRPAGVNQFDHSVSNRVGHLLRHAAGNQKLTTNIPKMLASASLPTLHPQAASTLKKPPALTPVASSPMLGRGTISGGGPTGSQSKGLRLRRASSDQDSSLANIPEDGRGVGMSRGISKSSIQSEESVRSVHDVDRDLNMSNRFSTPFTATASTQHSQAARTGTVKFTDLGDDDEVGNAFLKVRKERAVADIQRQVERDRAQHAEERENEVRLELEQTRKLMLAERERFEEESSALRKALKESVDRERQLRMLNEEAYKLLLLHGIQHSRIQNR